MVSETYPWCSKFNKCNGCKLQSECMVRPEELNIVFVDGEPVDLWAARVKEMILSHINKEAP